MHAMRVLQKCLGEVIVAMDPRRVRTLCLAVQALLAGRRLVLMDLARSFPGARRVRAPLKRLDRLLGLAARWDLPVVLHAPHGAAVGALELLKKHGLERAVFHWHKAPAEVTRAIVEAGYLVSVTPEIVYRARDRELVAAVPLESLLVESDAPWDYRGEFEGLASGPWFASRVAEEVAKIKQLPAEDVRHQLSSNACRLFELMWA